MKGDFSRWSFDPADNYTDVLEQQGRVRLEVDKNADTQISAYWRESIGGDVIGAQVAAVPASQPAGFRITGAQIDDTVVQVTLEPGRVWADGLHLFAGGTEPLKRAATYLGPPLQSPQEQASNIAAAMRDAVVLEAWEDSVSGFQETVQLLEPALGGPDTTERVKAFYALRLLRLGPNDDCATVASRLADDFSSKGKLTVTPAPALVVSGDCPIEAGGGYTGFEHYLYRIEIAEPLGPQARFKWSQFNGGLVGRGTFASTGPNTGTVTVTANDQAINHCGLPQFYLEALTLDTALGYWSVVFTADAALAQAGVLNLTNTQGAWPAAAPTAFFRLWNGIRLIADFLPGPANPNELKDGIRLEFEQPVAGNANYTPGDYWTFPVRAAGATLDPSLWPSHAVPQGVHYHRAPLAIITWGEDRTASYDEGEISDCRRIFRPLTNQRICCTFTVGDGVSSHGDFDSIEEALRHLPASGGEICLLPGLHQTNAVIEGRQNVRIKGCDTKTKVVPRQENQDAPIFRIADSTAIGLEHMDLTTLGGTAVLVEGTRPGASDDIEIAHNRILACIHAVRAQNVAHLNVHHNRIRMVDKADGGVGILLAGDDTLIERNDITVVPAPSMPTIYIPEAEPVDPVDPCARLEIAYANPLAFTTYVNHLWALALPRTFFVLKPFRAPGGIQIGPGSERVRILENTIRGGAGNGITLGSALETPAAPDSPPPVEHRVEPPQGRLDGRIVPPDGVAAGDIQFVFVRLSNPQESHSATTDAEGEFRLTPMPQDTYRVSVVSPGLEIDHIEVRRVDNPAITRAFISTVQVSTIHVITLRRAAPETLADPEPFAFLYDITIEDNDISLMGRSGIGQPPLELLPTGAPVPITSLRREALARYREQLGNPVIGLRIRRNRIHRCLKAPLETLLAEMRQRGLGGISLGFCQDLAIGENRIEANGVTHAQPVCGIFVAYGEEVEIAGNHITDNGPLTPGARLSPGRRGGIVLDLVSALATLDRLAGDGRGTATARPAARIHANLVDQPAGQALTITAMGPVQCTDNALSSELSGLSDPERMAGTVWILNVGAAAGTLPIGDNIAAAATATARALRVVPRGTTLFAHNQSRTGSGNQSAASQAIWVRDDLGYEGNQSVNLRGGNLFANAFVSATTLRAASSRFSEPSAETLLSLYTRGATLNTTALNQGDHCIIAVCPARTPVNPANQELDAGRCDRLRRRV